MIGTIIVPLDGSGLAEQALPHAQAIAEQANASLLLIRVIDSDASQDEEQEAANYLRYQAQEIGENVQTSVERGDPAEEIVEGAEDTSDPLIVMTTHGRTGFNRLLHGSVSGKVVRETEVPVLLMRSESSSGAATPIKTIMVPVDGSAPSESVLPYAATMARVFGAEIRLVQVAETARVYALMSREPSAPVMVETINEIGEQMVAESDAYLQQLAGQLTAEGITVKTVTLDGFPGEQLLAYEKQEDIDLVIMATRGRSGIGRLVFGSVAERMLKDGKTPVMMIKPDDDDDDDDDDDNDNGSD